MTGASALDPIPRWVGVTLMLLIATMFASNHIGARLAFDHGINPLTAVVFRSFGTALVVAMLLRATRTRFTLTAAQRWRALLIGLLIAGQSLCLYSAVARIPVALALLAFNTFPFLLGLISWLAGGERPSARVLVAMLIALAGLALALDLVGDVGVGTVAEANSIGVAFALAAALQFGLVLYLQTRWLGNTDGRIRSFVMMTVVGVVTLLIGLASDGFALPRDALGWLGVGLLTLFYGSAITSLFVVLPKLGAVNNVALMNFEPIAALILAWLLLGQTMAPIQLLGALIVVAAIVTISVGKR
jgi:drug/metabolite transporter (DMT)-like permease